MSTDSTSKRVVAYDLSALKFAKRGPFLVISDIDDNMLHLAEVADDVSVEAQFWAALMGALNSAEVATGASESLQIGFYEPFSQMLQTSDGVFSGRLELSGAGDVVSLADLQGPLEPHAAAAKIVDANL